MQAWLVLHRKDERFPADLCTEQVWMRARKTVASTALLIGLHFTSDKNSMTVHV
jgi:hypothetical protein